MESKAIKAQIGTIFNPNNEIVATLKLIAQEEQLQ